MEGFATTVDVLGNIVCIGDIVASSYAGTNRIQTFVVGAISKSGYPGEKKSWHPTYSKDPIVYFRWIRGQFVLIKKGEEQNL